MTRPSPPTCPLLIPSYRQVPFGGAQGRLPQLLQAEAVGLVAAQDRLDDVRREVALLR